MRDYGSHPWNCTKALKPDYCMRVFPQHARADYPTCYKQCQLIFLSLPAVCAAGLQAISSIIADVNLQGFIGRDWKTCQTSRHGLYFGFQQPLYNRQPELNVIFLSFWTCINTRCWCCSQGRCHSFTLWGNPFGFCLFSDHLDWKEKEGSDRQCTSFFNLSKAKWNFF